MLAVAYGSVITIRQLATTGGYLHSHKLNYPGGSGRKFPKIEIMRL
jgi:dolichyl-phosphate-mannose--protein O-mannosyl transferase